MDNVHNGFCGVLLVVYTLMITAGTLFVVIGIVDKDNKAVKEIGEGILIVVIALIVLTMLLLQYLN